VVRLVVTGGTLIEDQQGPFAVSWPRYLNE